MLKSDRYIIKQVLLATLFAVAILSMILVLGSLFKFARPLLVEDRAPISDLIKFLFSVMPSTLMFTLPWGFLVAVLLVFGRLSADNEIVSLRLAGQSIFRIATPVILIGLSLSGLSFWLNATVTPRSKAAQKDLLYAAVSKDPGALLQPGVVQSRLKEGQVYVESRNASELNNFHYLKFHENKPPSKKDDKKSDAPADITGNAYAYAQHATLEVEQATKQLRLSLRECYFESEDEEGLIQPYFAGEFKPLLFDFAAFERKGRNRPSGMENSRIVDTLNDPKKLPEDPAQRAVRVQALKSELTKRHSFSFACFAFSCIGVPLAISRQRRDTSAGFGLSLAVAGGYFLFLLIGENAGDHAPLIMWAPNVLCILLGIFLLRRANFR